jgi:hypothetical protein
MVDRDVILAVLQTGISLAGLLLIFSGFLFSRASSFSTVRGDKFIWIARATLIPVLMALALSWLSIYALEGSPWAISHLMGLLRLTLGATVVFAIVGVIAAA